MKKFLSFIMILVFAFSFSQTNRWSAYAVKVAPENEEMVVKLIDDYFSNNKHEGVTVSLYAIMFTAADLNFTHELIFSGEAEAMAKLYSPEFGDTSWQLFSYKMNSFVDENVFSGNGWRAMTYGDVMPFQMVHTLKGDNENMNKWRRMQRELRDNHPQRENTSFATGGINVGGPSNEANNWIVFGFKTYADYLSNWADSRKYREDNPKFVKDREKMNAEIDYSEIEPVKKFMRYLVKQW